MADVVRRTFATVVLDAEQEAAVRVGRALPGLALPAEQAAVLSADGRVPGPLPPPGGRAPWPRPCSAAEGGRDGAGAVGRLGPPEAATAQLAADAGQAERMGSDPVVVIGNFDGVHRGHVALLRTARAAEPDAPLVVVTFWPHPMSVVRPDQTPLLLSTLPRRVELLRQAGADDVVVVDFTSEVAGWSPEQFVDTVLRPLHPRRVVVGENFRFGFRAAGDRRDAGRARRRQLRRPARAAGHRRRAAQLVDPVRHAVAEGDFGRVRELSDHPFRFCGVVVQGDQRGRQLGYPTANVLVAPGMAVPADGVYAGWVTRLDEPDAPRWPAAISVGTNPTFDGVERRVESYVLDRDDLELYGVEIAVDFYARLRGQVKYAGMEPLIEQMHADVEEIRHLLGSCSRWPAGPAHPSGSSRPRRPPPTSSRPRTARCSPSTRGRGSSSARSTRRGTWSGSSARASDQPTLHAAGRGHCLTGPIAVRGARARAACWRCTCTRCARPVGLDGRGGRRHPGHPAARPRRQPARPGCCGTSTPTRAPGAPSPGASSATSRPSSG